MLIDVYRSPRFLKIAQNSYPFGGGFAINMADKIILECPIPNQPAAFIIRLETEAFTRWSISVG